MNVSIRNNKGFSLVELMVVVAIIGILAAIAIPNFQRFTAKSRQAEAKTSLSALYSAEKAFQGEWNTFTARFVPMGYAPSGDLRFEHGFGADFYAVPANYSGPSGTAAGINTADFCGGGTCQVINVPVAPDPVGAGAVATATTFIAEANADIDGDADKDVWTINDQKQIVNTNSDLN